MLRQDKERIVSELADRLKNSETLLVADYRGLTMTEIDDLRTKLLESGARFSVVKNTLTRLAAEEAGVKQLLDLVEGPTAIAFIDADGDPVAAARILNEKGRSSGAALIGRPDSAEPTSAARSYPRSYLRTIKRYQLRGSLAVAPATQKEIAFVLQCEGCGRKPTTSSSI